MVFCVIVTLTSMAQGLSTSDRKAEKLYHKAEEALDERDFDGASGYFKDAIRRDPNFCEPYLRLATIYNLYQKKDSALAYFTGYVRVTASEQVDWKIWRNLAYLNFEGGRYGEAQQALDQLLKRKPEHITEQGLKLLKASIEYSLEAVANPLKIEPDTLPREVNNYTLQYFPVLTVDNRMLIYTMRKSSGVNSDEDLVYSMRLDSGWSASQSISPRINTPLNEGACSVTADGRTLVFTSCDDGRTFGSCDLFMSTRQGSQWSKPQNMGRVINSQYWDSQPSISGDGRTLYFSSNRPGGYGMRDIWVSKFNGKDWSEPANLGSNINGFRDETTPFIHVNNNILLFSSTSYPGLGGYDLFYSKKKNNIWSDPKNLGYPINSYQDEVSLFVSANGADAYYSKEMEREGRIVSSVIVHFEMPSDSLKISASSYITGRVIDEETEHPLGAELKLMNLNDSSDNYLVQSDPVTGAYFLAVTEGKEYGVFVQRKNYLFENFSFRSELNTVINPDTVNVLLKPIKVGKSIVLKNIYFEFDDAKLNDKSVHELRSVARFLKSNPELKFQIEGHTDDRGNPDYNKQLSLNRARSVYDFLVNQSISPNRMVVAGFGASQPVSTKDTEEARERNRRIEFRVLK